MIVGADETRKITSDQGRSTSMRIAIVCLALGLVVMTGAIAYALVVGDFFGEAAVLLEHPWFHVSMIDLYTGFFLFSGWILYRERSPLVAIVWIVLLLTLGNLASCLYALVAAVGANGDWRIFWGGCRARQPGDATGSSVH